VPQYLTLDVGSMGALLILTFLAGVGATVVVQAIWRLLKVPR